jgi:hypothetical protein
MLTAFVIAGATIDAGQIDCGASRGAIIVAALDAEITALNLRKKACVAVSVRHGETFTDPPQAAIAALRQHFATVRIITASEGVEYKGRIEVWVGEPLCTSNVRAAVPTRSCGVDVALTKGGRWVANGQLVCE